MTKLRYFLNSVQVMIVALGLLWIISAPPTTFAVDPNEIYVQPVPGLKGGLFGITAKTAIEALIDDNYQVFCAAPTQEMSPDVVGEYKRFLELYFDIKDEDEKKITTKITEPGTIKNPLVADPKGDGFKNISAVNYQYRSKTEPENINAAIITDGVNRQLSLYQKAIKAKATREEVIARCGDLEDTLLRDCPLNIDIPSMAGIKIADIDINPLDILNPIKFKKIDKVLLQGMANMPDVSAIIKYARTAWLMVCFSQEPGPGVWFDGTPVEPRAFWDTSIWSLIGNFFIGKKDECYVKYITIPTAITEQNPYLEKQALEVHDAGKKAFMTLAQQTAEEERVNSAKGGRKELALGEEAAGFSNDKLINLKTSEGEFKKALAFIVNGTAASCDEKTVRTEEAPTIGSDSTAEEGGAKYKDSQDDAFGTWTMGGLYSTIAATFENWFLTGKRTTADLEKRPVIVRSYIFAPYSSYKDGKVSLESFFTTQRDYEQIRLMAQEYWETHAEFQDFLVGSSTDEKCESFEDYEKCHMEWRCNKFNDCGYVEICPTKSYCITGKDFGAQLSTQISDIVRGDQRTVFATAPKDSAAWKNANDNLGDPADTSKKTNIEKFLKGEGGSDSDGDDSGGNGESLACEEYKAAGGDVKLPESIDALKKLIFKVAKNNHNDAQLLYGLMKIEAAPLLDTIAGFDPLNGSPPVKTCFELITNHCGASGITGQLVPQCIESSCSAFGQKDDFSDEWINKIRENPEIGCDIEAQLEYTLAKRKSETTHLKTNFKTINGRDPTTQEFYYMMAGRNYGVPTDYLYQPGCAGYEEVPGCGGNNYCQCAMDYFPIGSN